MTTSTPNRWSWRYLMQETALPDCLTVATFVLLEVGTVAGVLGVLAWQIVH